MFLPVESSSTTPKNETNAGLPGAHSGGQGGSYLMVQKGILQPHPDEEDPDQIHSIGPIKVQQPQQSSDSSNHVFTKKRIILVLVFLLLLVAIAIPTVLFLGGDEEESPIYDQTSSTEPPNMCPLLFNLTNATLQVLDTPLSPQNLAHAFLEDIQTDYEPWQIRQRFAMMCVFFALDGTRHNPNQWGSSSWNIPNWGCSTTPNVNGNLPTQS